jgi:hypothetical protein
MENSYSTLWFDVRDILIKALIEIEAKSASIPHYRDVNFTVDKRSLLNITRDLLDVIQQVDRKCFKE